MRSGAADYAMLPIENTTSGSVHDAYDALSHTDLAIVGEEVLRIELCLVGVEDVPLTSLRQIYSHPQAIFQCTAFLASLPQVTVESFIDTAMSVERVKRENDPTHAAIASAEAATLHGLHILDATSPTTARTTRGSSSSRARPSRGIRACRARRRSCS